MNLQPFVVPALLAAFLFVGLFVLVWEWVVALRLRRERQELTGLLETRQQEARTAVELAVRAGRRLRKAEQHIKQLAVRLESLEMHGNDRAYSYDQAISQGRNGASANKLVANFGLNRSEAELVTLLHGNRSVDTPRPATGEGPRMRAF